MFSKNADGKLVLEIKNNKYVIDNNEDYKNLVIYLTDPNLDGREILTKHDLMCDSSIEGEDIRLCTKYAEIGRASCRERV